MSIQLALSVLGLDGYYMVGEPTNESEYQSMLTMTNGETNTITWAEIQTALGNGGAVPLHFLRIERNNMLTECDWTQVIDNGLTDSKKAEWVTYRQALRNLPSTQTNVSYDSDSHILGNVTFPTKP
tara:strand:+ start:2621 stop:2998 length:378 start_codon:yes stop_codon:yes gene_type:complete